MKRSSIIWILMPLAMLSVAAINSPLYISTFVRNLFGIGDAASFRAAIGVSASGTTNGVSTLNSLSNDVVVAVASGMTLQTNANRLTLGLDTNYFAINVKWPPFNAKGDGVTDDTAAIRAAAAYAAGVSYWSMPSNTLVIPAGTYKITGGITNAANISAAGAVLLVTGDMPVAFAQIASNASGVIPAVVGPEKWTNGYGGIGVLIENCMDCRFQFQTISGFGYGLVISGNGTGCCYNELEKGYFVNSRTNVFVTSANGGWANENTFRGPHCSLVGAAQYPGGYPYGLTNTRYMVIGYMVDNTRIYNGCFEGSVPEYHIEMGGPNTLLDWARYEQVTTNVCRIWAKTNAVNWELRGGYWQDNQLAIRDDSSKGIGGGNVWAPGFGSIMVRSGTGNRAVLAGQNCTLDGAPVFACYPASLASAYSDLTNAVGAWTNYTVWLASDGLYLRDRAHATRYQPNLFLSTNGSITAYSASGSIIFQLASNAVTFDASIPISAGTLSLSNINFSGALTGTTADSVTVNNRFGYIGTGTGDNGVLNYQGFSQILSHTNAYVKATTSGVLMGSSRNNPADTSACVRITQGATNGGGGIIDFWAVTNGVPFTAGPVATITTNGVFVGKGISVNTVSANSYSGNGSGLYLPNRIVACGTVTLTNGAAWVANTNAQATNVFQVSYRSRDGTLTHCGVNSATITNGSGFGVLSSNPTDTNQVDWSIVKP